MKNKILLILMIAFISTGCQIEYNLNVENDNITESVNVFASHSEDENTPFPSINIYDEYSTKPIPLFNDTIIQSESDDKIPGADYYKTTDITDDNKFGIKLSGTFNKDNIANSTIINYAYGNFEINQNETRIPITTKANFKLFDQYQNLEKVTINITTEYKVVENNADKVSGHTYTWVIDRKNYNNKPIELIIDKTANASIIDKVVDVSDNGITIANTDIPEASIYTFIFCGFFIVILIMVILFVRFKLKRNNRI